MPQSQPSWKLTAACLVATLMACLVQPARADLIETEQTPFAHTMRGPVSYWGSANNFSGTTAATAEPSDGTIHRAVYEIDLADVEAIVHSAELSVARWAGATGTQSVFVHLLEKPVVQDEFSWESYSASNAWDTPGGDFDPDLVTSQTVNITGLDWFDFDVTEHIQTAVDNGQQLAHLMLVHTPDAPAITWSNGNHAQYEPAFTATSEIPEPASATLLAAGAALCLLRRRR